MRGGQGLAVVARQRQAGAPQRRIPANAAKRMRWVTGCMGGKGRMCRGRAGCNKEQSSPPGAPHRRSNWMASSAKCSQSAGSPPETSWGRRCSARRALAPTTCTARASSRGRLYQPCSWCISAGRTRRGSNAEQQKRINSPAYRVGHSTHKLTHSSPVHTAKTAQHRDWHTNARVQFLHERPALLRRLGGSGKQPLGSVRAVSGQAACRKGALKRNKHLASAECHQIIDESISNACPPKRRWTTESHSQSGGAGGRPAAPPAPRRPTAGGPLGWGCPRGPLPLPQPEHCTESHRQHTKQSTVGMSKH